MELIKVTKSSDPELFDLLIECCVIDKKHVPKHGSGYVTPRATLGDGRKFEYPEVVWDYNWGIEWEYESDAWTQVEEFENICPHCGQVIT